MKKQNSTASESWIELHLHLDGAITSEIAKKLAILQNIELPTQNTCELQNLLQVPSNCQNLNDFLQCFALPLTLLQTKIGISEAVFLVASALEQQQVIYAELRFAPQLHTQKGLSQEEVILSALEGVKRSPIPLNLILCCMRGENTHDANLETLRLAKKYLVAHGGVVALDLAGAEGLYPTTAYQDIFAQAKQMQIPFTIHAGEAAGADSVETALSFGANRIGHGVRSFENPAVLEQLQQSQVALELCPTSNRQTNAIPNMQQYPLLSYLNQGICVTLNTDDMAICGITLADEFCYMQENFGLTDAQKLRLLQNAANAAFTDEATKRYLHQTLQTTYQTKI